MRWRSNVPLGTQNSFAGRAGSELTTPCQFALVKAQTGRSRALGNAKVIYSGSKVPVAVTDASNTGFRIFTNLQTEKTFIAVIGRRTPPSTLTAY